MYTNSTTEIYVDNILNKSLPHTLANVLAANNSFFLFGRSAFATGTIKLDNFSVVNLSYIQTVPVFPNTTASIRDYNLTSDGGCTNWIVNKNNPCSTFDTTPTVFIRTNITASCAIGINDLNYSTMNRNESCSTTGNSTEHVCTLSDQDELFYENSSVYISCITSLDTTNSTSSRLIVNAGGVENAARKAMEIGMSNSLGSGYSVYADQKLYSRNSANNQSVGVFDKVAKKLNKIWAFNRIGMNQSKVGMFNITPVFYNLEFWNVTNTSIRLEVEKLINATK